MSKENVREGPSPPTPHSGCGVACGEGRSPPLSLPVLPALSTTSQALERHVWTIVTSSSLWAGPQSREPALSSPRRTPRQRLCGPACLSQQGPHGIWLMDRAGRRAGSAFSSVHNPSPWGLAGCWPPKPESDRRVCFAYNTRSSRSSAPLTRPCGAGA